MFYSRQNLFKFYILSVRNSCLSSKTCSCRHARNFSSIQHHQSPSSPAAGSHDEPLRILFCGSDSFSCTTLQALHQEYKRLSSNIASIDVVCRQGKPCGRGLKSVRHRKYSLQLRISVLIPRSGYQTGGQYPRFAGASDQDFYWLEGLYLKDDTQALH
jgi:hypothetical protein